MPPLKILIIRHALSQGNRDGRMMGHLDDALTDEGIDQAIALAFSLAERRCSPSAVYSSPTRRALQTAEIVMHECGALRQIEAIDNCNTGDRPPPNTPVPPDDFLNPPPIIPCDDLKEFQNGIFQGLTWAEAQQRYPDRCQRLETSLDWMPIPGAESLEDGRMRARRFLHTLLNRHHNGDVIWVFSHEWIMQHLLAELMGGDRTWGLTIPHTSVFEFWLDRQRWFTYGQNRWNSALWKIQRFNDVAHLRAF